MGTQIPKKVPMGTRVPKWGPIWEQWNIPKIKSYPLKGGDSWKTYIC